jgi:hypothetical protein
MKKKSTTNYNLNLKTWVVFCKNTDIWWLKFLKKGFRHCFLILNDGSNWITYDPMFSCTEITVHKTSINFDLPNWFIKNGYTIISSHIIKQKNMAPISIFNCVESVKRVLGIHNLFIITPYQLYKHLKERNF